jgi:hypothetical protein
MDDDEGLIWAAVAAAVTLGASTLVKKALAKGWSSRRGVVPGGPGGAQASWKEAVVYAAASGAAVGLARLVADRALHAAKTRRPSVPPAA